MLRGIHQRLLVFLILVIPVMNFATPQEAKVNQRKIAKEHERKQKQAVKDYEKAVKHHNNLQSKSTRTSMKKTKKQSRKVTPIER